MPLLPPFSQQNPTPTSTRTAPVSPSAEVSALNNQVTLITELLNEGSVGDMAVSVYDPATIAQQVVGTTAVQTLTNKKIVLRVLSATAPGATPAIDTDNYDWVNWIELATGITGITLTGTPGEGQGLIIAVTDNGTHQTLALGSGFEDSTLTIPTTTIAGEKLEMLFNYNSATDKFRYGGSC